MARFISLPDMDEKTIEIIKETISALIKQMGFSGTISTDQETDDGSMIFNISTDTESHFLIGQHGINLQAMQHIARLMVRKHVPEKIRFVLDVNDYRKQKNNTITEQAREAAAQAISEHRTVIMKPMSTYERRLVHLELSKNNSVVTESVGEGDDRKIIVKPSDVIE
jgi:spoIIIJ-associated protein